MIQVLKRALAVLTYLSSSPSAPLGLGDIAEATGLNPSTCARILKTLVEEGYVEQVGHKKGYLLGPMAYGLSAHGPYRKDLVAFAEPLVVHLAKAVGETIVLATLSRGNWINLCEADGEATIQVRPDALASRHTPYASATGRMCLAHLSAPELDVVITRFGLPEENAWPGTTTPEALARRLDEIRATGIAIRDGKDVVAVAVPVECGGRVIAGLGSHLPQYRYQGEHRERLLAGLRETAAQIGRGPREEEKP